MQVIELNNGLQVSLNEILHGIQKLDTQTLDKFVKELNNLVKRKKAVKLPEQKEELIKRIKGIIPDSIKGRKSDCTQKCSKIQLLQRNRRNYCSCSISWKRKPPNVFI